MEQCEASERSERQSERSERQSERSERQSERSERSEQVSGNSPTRFGRPKELTFGQFDETIILIKLMETILWKGVSVGPLECMAPSG